MHAAGQGTPRDLRHAAALARQATEAAYDGASEMAALLMSWWIAGLGVILQMRGAWALGRARAVLGGMSQDVVNIGVLLGALCLVLWLQKQRRWNAAVRPARRHEIRIN